MSRKSISVACLEHRGAQQYALQFPYDQPLIDAAKAAGCSYSVTHRCWYLPATKENLNVLFGAFRGKAWLDCSALRSGPEAAQKKSGPVYTPLSPDIINDIARFGDWLRMRNYSENTIRTYTDCIAVFFRANPALSPREITKDHFMYFNKHYILSNGLSHTYQNQFVNALKLFLKELYRLPVEDHMLERPRREKKLPNVLSKQEVQLILQKTLNTKHRLLLSIAYACGLRLGEIIHLKLSDIDRARRVIHIRRSKGFKDRVVPLPVAIEKMLGDYLVRYQPAIYLIEGDKPGMPYSERSAQQVIKKSVTLAGIRKPVTMHWLRHSYATHLLEAGTDTRYIQLLLGHSSIKTTEIYTHVSNYQISKIASPLDDMAL